MLVTGTAAAAGLVVEGASAPLAAPAGSSGAPTTQPAAPAAVGGYAANDGSPAAAKGKGKGGKGYSAPPPPVFAPNAKAAKPKVHKDPPKVKGASLAASGEGGLSGLKAKVADLGEKMDKDHGMEIENVDLSGIDPNAKGATFTCPRCEQQILESLRESHMTGHSSEILQWLYLGSKHSANNTKELTVRTGITHILNVANEVTQDHITKEEWEAYNTERGLPTVYEKVSWTDTPDQDIIKEMVGPCEFIHSARVQSSNNKVLVHCVQGISRSTSVVIYYLMKHEGMRLRSAYELTKQARPLAEPRREFLDQLGREECRMFGLEAPSLLSEEVYAGKIMLNID